MRRWNYWGAAAGGFSRRFLSPSPSPASLRPLPSIPYASLPFPRSRHPPSLWLPPTFRPLVQPIAMAMQVRHYAKNERSRAPLTPATSKVKKYKLKAPSSMKFRFRTMRDSQIRRWRAGKRHNAHLKSKEAKRRLRKPALVHLAYAKVIKKLNFCG